MKSKTSMTLFTTVATMTSSVFTGAAFGQCTTTGAWLTIDSFVWIFPDALGCPEQESACSTTWWACHGFCGNSVTMYADADVDCTTSGNTQVASGQYECFVTTGFPSVWTFPPCASDISDQPQILSFLVTGFRVSECPEGTCFRGQPGSASAFIDMDRPALNWAVAIYVNGGVGAFPGPSGAGDVVRWAVSGSFGGSLHTLAVGNHSLGSDRTSGVVEVSNGNFEGSFDSSGVLGAFNGQLKSNAIVDKMVDFNNDGRFNAGDVAVAQAVVGSTWPTGGFPSLAQLDRDADGIADQSEVDEFADVLNSGLNAGVFGDLNGNGAVNCTDFGLVPVGAFSAELGDAAYRVQLDQNLDGAVSTGEQLEFYKRVGHPDFNLDGFIDFFDYDDFTAAFEAGTDMSADWNFDDFIDFFDYDKFADEFMSGGC